MKDQILKIIDAEGLTPARFADEIGVQRSSISHLLSGRNKPSYDFILKILKRFSGINAEWLITGQGSMIKLRETSSSFDIDLFEQDKSKQTVASHANTEQVEAKPAKNLSSPGSESKIRNELQSVTTNVDKSEVTNVNRTDFILVFYKDGTFKRFNPRD